MLTLALGLDLNIHYFKHRGSFLFVIIKYVQTFQGKLSNTMSEVKVKERNRISST